MSVTNQPYSCGESCPWKSCPECAYRGWESDVAQANPRVSGVRETGDFGTMGPSSETAPAETRQRLNRGLTTAQLPTRPGGASG